MNQIYRSNVNRKIAGVCGGIGEYLSISPDVVRILFLLGSFMLGLRYGFIIYIVAMLLMPQAPEGYSNNPPLYYDSTKNKNMVGIALIGLGTVLTLKRVFYINDIVVVSIILIAVGIYIMLKGGKNNETK